MDSKKFLGLFIPRASFYLWIILLLVTIIAVLNWRIAIPGFYDDIAPLSAYERKQMARMPMTARRYCHRSRAPGNCWPIIRTYAVR